MEKLKKYALIGKNIQDSLSPVIHQAYGCQYDLLDIAESELEWALKQPYDGFNVTSPYKEKILTLRKSNIFDGLRISDQEKFRKYPGVIELPRQWSNLIPAVNTLKRDRMLGDLFCYDTDAKGFIKALEMAGILPFLMKLPKDNTDILNVGILGGGSMAKMIKSNLRLPRVNPIMINGRTYNSKDLQGLSGLINATPYQEYNLDGLSKTAWVMDLGYKDDVFINTARARDNFAFNGMGMLIAQAEESQKIWRS